LANVLVVEDNADLRELYEVILDSAGHTVRLAETVTEAHVILEILQPDVLVLGLGGLGGSADLVDAVRERHDRVHLPIVLASGARDLEKWADSLGADGVLPKPMAKNRAPRAFAVEGSDEDRSTTPRIAYESSPVMTQGRRLRIERPR
jgi:DNA-binding response OmpR family regulator